MSALDAVLVELDAAMVKSTPARRSGMLRRFTDQLIDLHDRIPEEHVVAFDRVIVSLAKDVELEARRELSRSVAALRHGPRLTVRELAFDDDVGVSTPVLQYSPCIGERDLIEIATVKSQGHLMAIARRRGLTETVTDILVDRGDSPVHTTVGGNQTARFSERAMGRLAELAEVNDSLRDALHARRDVPPVLMTRLMAKVERMAAATIAATTASASRDDIDNAVSQGGRAVQKGLSLWSETKPGAPPSEADIVRLFREQRVTEGLLGLAVLAGAPPPLIIRIFASGQAEPLLCALKKVGFAWDSAASILRRRAGAAISAGELHALEQVYAELTPAAVADALGLSPSKTEAEVRRAG